MIPIRCPRAISTLRAAVSRLAALERAREELARSLFTRRREDLAGGPFLADHTGVGVSDFRFNAIINEEVAYTGTVYDNFSLTNDIVLPYLLELTTEELGQLVAPWDGHGMIGTNLAQDWLVSGLQLIYCFIYYYLLIHLEQNSMSMDAWFGIGGN